MRWIRRVGPLSFMPIIVFTRILQGHHFLLTCDGGGNNSDENWREEIVLVLDLVKQMN
jgi:hypothetical protein|tara:strand:- start:281 stop:454 length:174 start_codon:yes stop_codon:yes gene_type:complete